jgi:tetratricopeptide (TPR) repeat protein
MNDDAPTLTVGGCALEGGRLSRGHAIGRYIIVDHLGSGGMGAVYAAYDPELDRRVALKLLHADAQHGGEGDERDEPAGVKRERLLGEAQALAQLAHPNVVAIHDVGSTEAGVFIAMELVVGRTLRVWLREHSEHGWTRIAPLFRAAGEGLAAAHRAGIIHRDFKPENVVVGDDGRVRVVDFGLALAEGATLAEPGWLLGTPRYMAPEQLTAGTLDARTDQFTFCVTLYEALYGERPFAGATADELKESIAKGLPPDPPAAKKAPARVRRAIRRGLEIAPSARHASMDALLRELQADAFGTSKKALALASLGGVMAVAAGVMVARARAATDALCSGGEAQARSAWNDAARERMGAAFAASGKPFAGDALRSVTRSLDAYVPRWTAMRREACEATRIRGEQSEELLDLRMACLDGALAHVRQEVEIFTAGGDPVVERAPAAAQQLPSLAACADAARLRGAPPLPGTREGRAQFDAMSGELARGRALSYTGDLRGAEAVADRILTEGRAAGLPRIESAALVLRAKVRTNLGQAPDAEADLWDASLRALREHDDERAVEAWGLLVFVQGSQLAHYVDADHTAQLASAAMVRLGDADALRGALMRNQAAYLIDAGRYDEAVPLIDQALIHMERALGTEHPNFASTLETLGILQHVRGQQAAALRTQERVLAIRERLGGPSHPLVAITLFNVALAKAGLGRPADALADCARAMQLATAVSGADSSAAVDALQCVAAQQRELGDVAAARATDEDALKRAIRAGREGSGDTGYALQGLAADALLAGDGETAVAQATRARASLREALGPEHPGVLDTEVLLGRGQALAGHLDEAQVTLAHVLAGVERLKLDAPTRLGEVLRALGDVQLRRGDGARARPPLERALALAREARDGDPLNAADARASLASALALPGGDVGRARALAAEAASAYAARGRGAERRLASMRELLARLGGASSP